MQTISRRCDFLTNEGNSKQCGREATVARFDYQGTRYLVDLCVRHEEMLTSRLAPFTAVAVISKSYSSPNRPQVDVRTWLKQRGHDVKDTGRIPDQLRAVYENETGRDSCREGDEVEA